MILGFSSAGILVAIIGGFLISYLSNLILGSFGLYDISILPFLSGAIITGLLLIAVYLWPVYLALTRQNIATERYLSRLLKLFPNRVIYLGWRGRVRQDLGLIDAALDDYRKGIQIATEKNRGRKQLLQMYSNRAELILQRGQIDAALKDINTVLDINPQDVHALRVHAEILIELEDLEVALESAEYAVSLNPQDIMSLTKQAKILAKMKLKDEAVEVVHAALKVMPNEMTLYTHLANVLILANAYEEALLAVEKGRSQTSNSLVLGYLAQNEAVAYRYLGRYDEAMQSYDIAMASKYPEPLNQQMAAFVWGGRGVIHFIQEDYTQAKVDFQQAFDAWPQYSVSLLGLAAAQYAHNEHETALQTWKRFQEIPSLFHNLKSLRKEAFLPETMFDAIDKMQEAWET
jgi:tetratricopeptide (TPR) repeat protein